jgi:hypothetical protein
VGILSIIVPAMFPAQIAEYAPPSIHLRKVGDGENGMHSAYPRSIPIRLTFSCRDTVGPSFVYARCIVLNLATVTLHAGPRISLGASPKHPQHGDGHLARWSRHKSWCIAKAPSAWLFLTLIRPIPFAQHLLTQRATQP